MITELSEHLQKIHLIDEVFWLSRDEQMFNIPQFNTYMSESVKGLRELVRKLKIAKVDTLLANST